MKKFTLMLLVVIVLCMALAGCSSYRLPYKLEWQTWQNWQTQGGRQMRLFVAKEVYYCEENGPYGADIQIVDADGKDLPNPSWHPVDPEYGELEAGPAPNQVYFWPKKRGTVTVEAEQDGYVARTTVIILPHAKVAPGNSLDIDDDGQADYVSSSDGVNCQFPFGATLTNVLCIPEAVGEIAIDYPAPPSEPYVSNNPNGNSKVYIVRSSSGSIYAVMVAGVKGQTVCWRLLR